MKSYREQLEEIWPVPEGVIWNTEFGRYMVFGQSSIAYAMASRVQQARLDTFTSCQETTDVYLSLVDDLVNELDEIAGWVEAGRADGDDVIRATRLTDRAKKILGRE